MPDPTITDPDSVVRWLGAQTHSGENIGDTPTHVVSSSEHPGTAGYERGLVRGPLW